MVFVYVPPRVAVTSTVTVHEPAVVPVPGWSEDLMISVDGQQAMTLGPDDRVELKRGAEPVKLVRFGPHSYFSRMRQSLRWGDLVDRETTPP